MSSLSCISTRGRNMIHAAAFTLCFLLAPLPSPANPVDGFFDRLHEQQAAFESFQVVRRFFVCGVEAANANLFPQEEAQILEEAGACLRSLLAKDVVFDNDGRILTGEETIVALGTGTGGFADVRQNVSVTLESPLVMSFNPGRRPGTGEITLSLQFELVQEVVAPGPFGNVLGGQVGKFRDEITFRATRPHQWEMQRLVVRSQSFQSGLQLSFPVPFPRFPMSFPAQRGEASGKR